MTVKLFFYILFVGSMKSFVTKSTRSIECVQDKYELDVAKIYFDDLTYSDEIEISCDGEFNVSGVVLLDFSGDQFPNEVFTKFPKVKEITIEAKNNLNVLNENFFTGESQNEIKTLWIFPAKNYEPKNKEKIQIYFPAKFPELYELTIQSFNFGTIEKFKFNEKLTELRLGWNKIKKLEKETFAGLPNLEILDLRVNEIEILHRNLLHKNLKLKKFWFNHNQIKVIPRKFLWGLIELELISFRQNEIRFFHADLLKDNHKLTKVDFRDNKIQKFSPHFSNNLPNLRDKWFDNNPCTRNRDSNDFTICFKQWNDTVNSIENDSMVCGKPLQLQALIFGGTPISRGKYPWIAAFYDEDKFQCGSSLISSKHILLAAHCIHPKMTAPKNPKDCSFKLGKFHLTADEPGSLGVEVSEFILHPYWDAYSYEYRGDIAVAVLKTIVEFTQFIRPICLNEQKLSNFHDKTGTVIGWGATEQNPKMANDVALEVNVKIHETRECLHLDQDLKFFISPESFCAGNRNNTGSCSGDSGGALIVKSVSGFKAVGVVSSSVSNLDGYCDNTKNQIYTEVAAYYDWVMDSVFATY